MKFSPYILFLLLTCSQLMAQKSVMEGTTVGKHGWTIQVKHLAYLPKDYNGSFQGMDIYNGTLVSLQNHGMATLYSFNGKKLKRKSQFPLSSYNNDKLHLNHANVACFSRQFLQKGDKLPLIYVTRCNYASQYQGMDQVCFVEQIDPDAKTSRLVQVIAFKDPARTLPHSTQWVLDVENDMLYGYGNSRENPNRHFIVQFKRPPYRGEQDSVVVLEGKDMLDSYFIEDTYQVPGWQPIIQGATIKDGLLYLPMGVGKASTPSYLYIWNLKTHQMEEEFNLQAIAPVELEDCTFLNGKLIVQASRNLFEFSIKK